MESFPAARALGEESLQMWDLNKRLEAYLARVKFLEEENELLRAEIQGVKDRPAESSWRCKYEEELGALRATLDDAFREKHAAELTRDNLLEEIQHVKSCCQKERAAQEDAKKQLALSKKELEEEKRAQIWLRERATQLEKEVEVLVEVHEEEKAGLEQEMANFSQSLESVRTAPVAFQPVEVEDYSRRLSEIWRGAVETYKSEVSQLESSFCQAKENLWKAVEGNRQSQLHLQQLEKELAGLKTRKGMLEESVSRQWQDQRGEAKKFQLALEALEREKEALGVQIAHVLEERQQLMHLKMSLGLEVATYRTLLEAESTRLQMPSAEYKLVNGFRDAKLERSNSKLQAVTPESRRLVSWDHQLSPTTFQKGESKARLPRTQIDSPKLQAAAGLPKRDGPVAREFQKINSVLQSPLLKSAQTARDSVPAMLGSSQAGETIKAADAETVANSFSQKPLERLDLMHSAAPELLERSDSDSERRNPAADSGDPTPSQVDASDVGQEDECYEEAKKEVEKDPSEEPPGKLVPEDSLSPSHLVNEALEDALKEVRDGAEPAVDSSPLQADRAPNDLHSYDSAPLEEAYGLAASPSSEVWEGEKETEYENQKEAIHPAEQLKTVEGTEATAEMDGGLEPHFEEETREADMQEFPDVKSSAQQDREEPQSGLDPSSNQNEESIPDILATEGRPEIETREEVGSWEQNEGQEEETPRSQSTDMCRETDAVCKNTERGSPLQEGGMALSGAEGKSWEAGISGHRQLPAVEGAVEDFDRGEDDLEVVSTEALHLSEDEERRELWSPSRENEEDNFQAELLESEFLQAEIQAAHAFPMESHPALVVESPQEQHLSGAEQEKFEQQEMSLHETDATVGEEGRKEVFSDRELLSTNEGTFGDETVPKAEENIPGDETLDRTRGDSEEHKEKLEEETLGCEDLSGDEYALRHENLKQEKDTLEEEVGDLQENGFEHDIMLAHEGLEDVQRLESLGREKEVAEDYQRHLPKEQEGEGKEEAAEEAADIALQEPAWADTLMTSTEGVENEREPIKGSLGAEMGDDDDAGHFIGSEHPTPHHEAGQEASPGTELMEEDQCGSKREHEDIQSQPALQPGDPPSHEISHELTEVLEEPWEKVDDACEAGEERREEPKGLENINTASQAPGDSSESEDSLGSLEDVSLNASQKTEELEEELESGGRIMLEETLPDSTPLRFYAKEVLAEATSSQQPPVSDDSGDSPPAPESTEVSQEGVGQLEDRAAPTSSQEKERSEEDESVPVLARTSERMEEEGGYFRVSAPNQETASLEEAESSEDFEEIKAEISNLAGDDPEMIMVPSEVPRDERVFEAESEQAEGTVELESDTGKESEGREFPPEESVPHCSAFTWEPEKEDGFPIKASDCDSIAGGAQTESEGMLEATEPGDLDSEDAQKVSPLTSMADLGEIVLEGQLPLSQKGSPDSTSTLSSEDESPNVTQSHLGSDPEVSGGLHPGQPKDATEVNQSSMDHSVEMVAKIPADVMKDSDILEIVEQALEFNQELMLGARLSALHAGDEQQAAGGVDVSDQTQEVGRDGGMCETGALQETLLVSSPQAKELTASSHIWTESNTNGELNGLHGEQILNGVSDLQPVTDQNDCAKSRGHEVSSSGDEFFGKVTITQELHGEEPEAFPISETMLSQSPLRTPDYEEGHGAEEEHPKKGQDSNETDNSKFADLMWSAHMQRQDLEAQTISVPSPFGDNVFPLGPSQHLKFQLKDDQESWSSEDD